jgi:hypothetical protein
VNLKERENMQVKGTDGRIILKFMLTLSSPVMPCGITGLEMAKQNERAFTTTGSYEDRPYFIKYMNFFTS